jgi:hypothetical protein
MDLSIIFSTILDFLKLYLPLVIIVFVLYKIFSKVRVHIENKYSMSWTKSCLVMNFLIFFLGFLIIYLYYFFLGAALAVPADPEINYNIIDNLVVILFASVRMIVAAIILALMLYFFELVGSFVIDVQKLSQRKLIVKQFIGVAISSAIFLILILFVFNWVPLGIIIYVFYGGIKPLPLVI